MTLRPRGAPDWSENHHRGPAKCRSLPQPDRGNDLFFDSPWTALAICNGTGDGVVCPRRTECLRAAMHNAEPYGVWGGMTAQDRLQMRLRYPGAPERWTWHPYSRSESDEEFPCRNAS
jgi:hypothetical protein